VKAGGKTASELSTEIAARLKENYLQSPSVSVLIDDSVSQRVTVEGAVTQSGIYPVQGKTTLMQALALAQGPDNKVADLKHVMVFRTIDSKRAGAMFNVDAIRKGAAQDPLIYGGDTVIVYDSKAKQAWLGFVSILPGLGVFGYL